MVFLLCLIILEYVAVTRILQMCRQVRERKPVSLFLMVGIMASPLVLGFPLVWEFFTVLRFEGGGSVSMNGGYWVLWFLGIGATITVIVFGWQLYLQRKQPTAGFFAVGANAVCLMIGAYMVFVVADQLVFYAPPRQDSGMLNLALFKELGTVDDVQCDQVMVVIKDMDKEVATYRCPSTGILVLGRFGGTPIVPWPAYTEGRSHDLPRAMRELMKDSDRAAVLDHSNESP